MFLYQLKRNAAQVKGGVRNLLDGSSCMSAKHIIAASNAVNGESEDVADVELYTEFYGSKFTLGMLIYCERNIICRHSSDHVDLLILSPPDSNNVITIKGYNFDNADYDRADSYLALFTAHSKMRDVNQAFNDAGLAGLVHLLNKISAIHMVNTDYDSATCALFNRSGDLVFPNKADGRFGSWDFMGQVVHDVKTENKAVQTENNAVSSNTQPNTVNKEVKMSKVTQLTNAVVSANKSSAVTAAKIEAGTIVLDRAVKLLKPKMPFGTSGMLDSPVGRVALANVVNLLVEQYASNNPKAVVISGAVMDAAMLNMVQSFNIGALIDDLISNVDVTAFSAPAFDAEKNDAVNLDLSNYQK